MLNHLFIFFLSQKPESDKMLQEPAQQAAGRKGQQVVKQAELEATCADAIGALSLSLSSSLFKLLVRHGLQMAYTKQKLKYGTQCICSQKHLLTSLVRSLNSKNRI